MKPQVIQIRTAYEASNSMVEKLSEQLKQKLQVLPLDAPCELNLLHLLNFNSKL